MKSSKPKKLKQKNNKVTLFFSCIFIGYTCGILLGIILLEFIVF